MRLLKQITLMVYSLSLITGLNAEVGCMDNSWHLEKKYDDHSYHYVSCNCPCSKRYKIFADRGRCMQCRHFRDPKPYVIITSEALAEEIAVTQDVIDAMITTQTHEHAAQVPTKNSRKKISKKLFSYN